MGEVFDQVLLLVRVWPEHRRTQRRPTAIFHHQHEPKLFHFSRTGVSIASTGQVRYGLDWQSQIHEENPVRNNLSNMGEATEYPAVSAFGNGLVWPLRLSMDDLGIARDGADRVCPSSVFYDSPPTRP